jgi:hypothetical protein
VRRAARSGLGGGRQLQCAYVEESGCEEIKQWPDDVGMCGFDRSLRVAQQLQHTYLLAVHLDGHHQRRHQPALGGRRGDRGRPYAGQVSRVHGLPSAHDFGQGPDGRALLHLADPPGPRVGGRESSRPRRWLDQQ